MAKRFYPQHLKQRRRRMILAVLSFVVFTVLGIGAFFYQKEKSKVVWVTYRSDELKISLSYPENFSQNTLSEEGKKAGYILRIFRETPPAIFSLRREDKLGMVRASGKEILDYLIDQVNRRYPERFPEYKKEGFGEINLAGERAVQFDFTYTGADGKTRMKQQLAIVVKGETAFYFSAQTPENEFSKSAKDFDRIVNSFEFAD